MSVKRKLFIFSAIMVAASLLIFTFLRIVEADSHPFKAKLLSLLKSSNLDNDRVSIYLYSLSSRKEIGINETRKYMPASLMKVSILFPYYKASQTDPAILQKKIVYEKRPSSIFKQNIKPFSPVQEGQSYTIDELISHMIKYSDNVAANLLFENMDKKSLENVFVDLGLEQPDFSNIKYTISAKDYARFFIALYDHTYVNKQLSRKALDLLVHSEYDKGLVAGIPKSIAVAHKFGELALQGPGPTKLFHECGIVYYPHDPYLLCVMTQGHGMRRQSELIKKISQFVYENYDQKIF